MKKLILPFMALSTIMMANNLCAKDFSLDFSAEHLSEALMDARYIAFPAMEFDAKNPGLRGQLGYVDLSSGKLHASSPLLGLQYYMPLNAVDGTGILFSGFYDAARFDGDQGTAVLEAHFVQLPLAAQSIPITINRVSGNATHAGFTTAYTQRESPLWGWQAGLAAEYYKINEFAVDFTTLTQPTNYAGQIDFAGNYHSFTPYSAVSWFLPDVSERFIYSTRVIAAWPLPRRGFKGSISTPGFTLAGDTEKAGNGIHIPDFFAGFGFSLLSRSNGWSIDIGASAYLLGFEQVIHEGVNKSLLITLTLPLN